MCVMGGNSCIRATASWGTQRAPRACATPLAQPPARANHVAPGPVLTSFPASRRPGPISARWRRAMDDAHWPSPVGPLAAHWSLP